MAKVKYTVTLETLYPIVGPKFAIIRHPEATPAEKRDAAEWLEEYGFATHALTTDTMRAEIHDALYPAPSKETAMKRSARNIVIYFSLTDRKPVSCRLVVGQVIETESRDCLGAQAWVKADRGTDTDMPGTARILEQALAHVFSDLPPWTESTQMYPTGVLSAVSDIEIRLGRIDS